MGEGDYRRYCAIAARRRHRFDAYRDEIIEMLTLTMADGQKVYVSSVYDLLEERHGRISGSVRTLSNYIRMLRETGAIEKRPIGRVRRPQPESEPGVYCQVDFGQQRIASGETAYIFVAVLSSSRVRYVSVQDHPFRTREVVSHVLASFRYFGGRPQVLVIDQDKLMTVRENAGEIVHTEEFEYFLAEQELRVWLCRKADPQAKGKVENAVKFVKTSFFSARRFESVQQIHTRLADWLARRANGRICQGTGRVPALVLEREELQWLRALRPSIYENGVQSTGESRKANAQAMISFGGNRYSVPQEYAGSTVSVVAERTHLSVRDSHRGEEIARHRIRLEKAQTVVAPQHRVAYGKQADEVYQKLSERFPAEIWKRYLQENLHRFKRYWKEQAVILLRIAEQGTDADALNTALEFCLESGSVGAGDLCHAYEHLVEARRSELTPLLEHAKPIMAARKQSPAGVPKRSVGYYSSLLSLLVGSAV